MENSPKALKTLTVADLLHGLAVHSPEELTIVSGAGVSVEHPTHAPSGANLLSQALQECFLPGLQDELTKLYQEVMRITHPDATSESRKWMAQNRPRLETVLDVVHTVGDPTSQNRLADNFRDQPVNRLHHMLAAHLHAGGRQATANFDRLIEDAGSSSVASKAILHFHGEVTLTDNALPFGSRLSEIEHGFSKTASEELITMLTAAPTRAVVWIGYSFSDYFDVTPAICAAVDAGRFDEISFVWCDYGNTDPTVEQLSGESTGHAILDTALRRGLSVYRLQGRVGDALYHVLKRIGVRLDASWQMTPQPCHCRARPESSPAARTATNEELITQKREATIRLIHRLGLIGRIANDGSFLGLTVSDIPDEFLADYWWKKGKYRRARLVTLNHITGDEKQSSAMKLLAEARFDWIEGRLSRAGHRLVTAITALAASRDGADETLCDAFERFGRLAVHMQRSPDTRYFVLPLLLRRLPDYNTRARAFIESVRKRWSEGFAPPATASVEAIHHLLDALANFHKEVLKEAHIPGNVITLPPRTQLIESFGQSESLANLADYTRGEGNDGRWPYPLKGEEDWRDSMIKLYQLVGNEADIRRLVLFTQSQGAFANTRTALEALWQLDASFYQRIRFLTKYYIDRSVSPRHN